MAVAYDDDAQDLAVWTFDAAVDVSACDGTGLQLDLGAGLEDPIAVTFIGTDAVILQYSGPIPAAAPYTMQAAPGGITVPGGTLHAPQSGTMDPDQGGVSSVAMATNVSNPVVWTFPRSVDISAADGTGLSIDPGSGFEDPVSIIVDTFNSLITATYSSGMAPGDTWDATALPGGMTVPRGSWTPSSGTVGNPPP